MQLFGCTLILQELIDAKTIWYRKKAECLSYEKAEDTYFIEFFTLVMLELHNEVF